MTDLIENTINTTPEFDDWLDGVRNAQGKAALLARLDRAKRAASVIVSQWGMVSVKCGSLLGLGTELTSFALAGPLT
ncbi:hypothetical protein ALR00_200112 [Pseudomonas savastanoi pv. retacarpa]|nr:hypothetical protein ALR00_200112 [Pseudomonas savastanoi pv. retacarpa]